MLQLDGVSKKLKYEYSSTFMKAILSFKVIYWAVFWMLLMVMLQEHWINLLNSGPCWICLQIDVLRCVYWQPSALFIPNGYSFFSCQWLLTSAVIGFIYTRVFWREKLVINSWVKEAILLYAFIIHQGLYYLECVLEMRSSMHLFTYCILLMDPSTYSTLQPFCVFL